MPIYDYLFGTQDTHPYFEKQEAQKIDFTFIGHPGNVGHLLTLPEWNIYHSYSNYSRVLPVGIDAFLTKIVADLYRKIVSPLYKSPAYRLGENQIGQVLSISYSPIDFLTKHKKSVINSALVKAVSTFYKQHETRYFGLGNMTKSRELNHDGKDLLQAVRSELGPDVRLWTGDTMTVAVVDQQLRQISDLESVFFIGATGKIGNPLCTLLSKRGIKVRALSRNDDLTDHDLISYTSDISEMSQYRYIIVGGSNPSIIKPYLKSDQMILDYTVPFVPLSSNHKRLGILICSPSTPIKGYYDQSFGVGENRIYACHAGCIINAMNHKTQDEVGAIDLSGLSTAWAAAQRLGLTPEDITSGVTKVELAIAA